MMSVFKEDELMNKKLMALAAGLGLALIGVCAETVAKPEELKVPGTNDDDMV